MDDFTVKADDGGPAWKTPGVGRKVTNQMRVWELEQKRLVPDGLLFINSRGVMRTVLPVPICEIDNDPLAIRGSVIPKLPGWVRDFLLSALTSVYHTPPRFCEMLHGVLVESKRGPHPVDLSISTLQPAFFWSATYPLRVALADLETFSAHLREDTPVTPQMYSLVKQKIESLVNAYGVDAMPVEVGRVVRMLERVENGHPGARADALLDGLTGAVVRPYKELLYKLDTVTMWADRILDKFEVSKAT